MQRINFNSRPVWLVGVAVLAVAPGVQADEVTDWNVRAGAVVTAAQMAPPPANRVMAIMHTAIYDAVRAVARAQPRSASLDGAIAAAGRLTLLRLVPSQVAAIDKGYQEAVSKLPDNEARAAGISVGEQAATAVLAARADDGAAVPEAYRPATTPGVYVPTVIPAVPAWPQRRPWLMTSAAQFRPGPPPALSSTLWARDFNEVKSLGGKSGPRTPEQTAIAIFWEATLPPIYTGLARSVADQPGRTVAQNAALFAAASQAMDDALIAVFEAKYTYSFWRPVTAIRNGDTDGNPATERDAGWSPFIATPLHPEYPCAHCTVAGALGAVLRAVVVSGAPLKLTTHSTTANGASRSWTRVEDFVQEVVDARVYDGVHYRNSGEVGTMLGKQIGELAVLRFPQSAP